MARKWLDRAIVAIIVYVLSTYINSRFSSPETVKLQKDLDQAILEIRYLRGLVPDPPLWHLHNWRSESSLLVAIPAAPIDYGGTIVFETGVKRLWLDIGARVHNWTSPHFLDKQTNLAVISFEPMFEAWGRSGVGYHDRFISLPLALTSYDGFALLTKTKDGDCSSIKELNKLTVEKQVWPKDCSEIVTRTPIPVAKLETIIALIPSDIDIEYTHIDAQGSDFDIIKSGGEALSRLNVVVLELHTTELYVNAPLKIDVMSWMSSKGFVYLGEVAKSSLEVDILFRNKNKELPEHVAPLQAIISRLEPQP